MRIDKFLKNARIIKRRTVAKEACDKGRVMINGKIAKAGTEVASGDLIEIQFNESTYKFKVLELLDHVKKEDATNMFEVIE